jgi:NAD(P)-dependent dehydrogenase (short-subunit alcohol dehydrogenase family)
MRLRDKVAVITGAAHGMGEAAAKLFAREGAKVIVADILEADGAQVAASIAATGANASFVRLDIANEEAWKEAIRSVVSRLGRLDVLVNNAGVSGAVGADLTRTEDFDRIMAINARGTYLGVKHAVPEMRRIGGGSIVNVSSISGFIGQAFVHMGYNASKAAIRFMTKAAAVQHAKDGIRVNSVHPGIMPPMGTSVSTADPALREKILAGVPMGRAGRVEEAAYAMLFLASDEASYITGTELVVDGGFLAV